jgi:hypothetical protein
VLLALAVGCGPTEPTLLPVAGRLARDGKPLGNVQIDFHPDPDAGTAGPSSAAVTAADGTFTLTCPGLGGRPGAVAGRHRVILTDLDRYGNVFVGRGDYRTEGPRGPKATPKLARFPARYSDLTNPALTHTVAAGMGPVELTVTKK